MEQNISAPAAERRHTTRADCCYQVECSYPQGSFKASVVNMGLGGMRLLAAQELQVDDSLSVSQADMGSGSLMVKVVWCRSRPSGDTFESGVVYRDGLEALDRSWVKIALGRLGFEARSLYERRRTVRAHTSVPGGLTVAGRVYPCTMLDLGLGGALVQTDKAIAGLQDGASVSLAVQLEAGPPLAARVVYSRQLEGEVHHHGLCFEADRLTQAQARLVEGYMHSLGH